MLGDVILLKGTTKSAPFNLAFQRLWTDRFDVAGYTHVALASGPWQAIHAMPEPWHVEIAAIHELLSPGVTWSVWRNTAFAARLGTDSTLAIRCHDEFSKSLGEAYNKLFFLSDDAERSYCSQLVGKLATHIGYSFARPAHDLMPLDIAAEVERSDAWLDVSSEYHRMLEADDHYRRLFRNPNRLDANAHQAAYLHSKAFNNEMNRGFVALAHGEGPQSRVERIAEGRAISVGASKRPPLKGLDGRAAGELPDPYHGSIVDWDRLLNPAAQWLDGALFTSPAPRHDVVLVLGHERVAKMGALLFDAVIAIGNDRVPEAVKAWGANERWSRGAAALLAAARQRANAGANARLRVRSPSGQVHIVGGGDAEDDADALGTLLETAYLRNHIGLQDALATGLRSAGFEHVSLMLSHLPDAGPEDAVGEAMVIELSDVELVDVDRLSWEDIVAVRDDVAAMRGLRSLRDLLVTEHAGSARPDPAARIAEGWARHADAARSHGLPTIVSTLRAVLRGRSPLAGAGVPLKAVPAALSAAARHHRCVLLLA